MAGTFQSDAFQSNAFQADAAGGSTSSRRGCKCCRKKGSSSSGSGGSAGSGASAGSGLSSSASGRSIESCTCPGDCTPATRYLTISGTSDCDGTYALACVMDAGTPKWRYTGTFGIDTLGFICNTSGGIIWELVCGFGGFYGLVFQPPGEGSQGGNLVAQQCVPFYAEFEFPGLGLIFCCDYTGTPRIVVTD